MHQIIRYDLTTGRLDYDLTAFTEKEILDFIENNSTNIHEAINNMYEAYKEDKSFLILHHLIGFMNIYMNTWMFPWINSKYINSSISNLSLISRNES